MGPERFGAGLVIGPGELERAVEVLRSGGLVAFPTETVYGLGADALNARAVEGVFRAKGRPRGNPLIVHVDGQAMAREMVAGCWSERAASLAGAFWPGPLALVVERGGAVPGVVAAGGATVGVRCPDHPVALELIERFGGPLVGPSANVSGGVSPTEARHVAESLPGVLVVDGGACRTGIESTVVDVTGSAVRVLRPGVIGAEALERVLGEAVVARPGGGADARASGGEGGSVRSPGVLGAHYRPRATVVVCATDELRCACAGAARAVALVRTPEAIAEASEGPPVVGRVGVIEMARDAAGYAAGLYAALRRADEMGADLIVVESPPMMGARDGRGREWTQPDRAIWEAVADRLGRASAPG